MRKVLFFAVSLAAFAQNAPLELPEYGMFRYAVVGRPFSYRFQVAGGAAPYAFSAETGSALPPGLALNTTTGELSGMVAEPGEFRHTVCISDTIRQTICVPFLVIATRTEAETYTELIPARVNVDYNNMIMRPGEFAEVAYDPTSGRIPTGMILEVTGRLYGIPAAPNGAWAFRVRARDSENNIINRGYLIRVLGPLSASTRLPNAFSGTEYSASPVVIGDAPPHTWSVRRGPIPPGFAMSDAGRISGICNIPGVYNFALRVTDNGGSSHDKEMSITVEGALPPLTISNDSLPGGAVGVPYRQQLNASGGREPYAFRVIGALPPGITLSPSALLSGTPTAEGNFLFTIEMTDVSGARLSKTLRIIIGNLRLSGPSTYTIYSEEAATIKLIAEGGAAPYRWSVVSGSFPTGITLAEDGTLSGTPGAVGTSSATVRVTDSTAKTLETLITLNVGAARPVISTNGIANAASFAAGPVAPGEIVVIYGRRMGPAQLATFLLDGNQRVPAALAGTRVLFGGIPAPLLYVSATQLSAIVPYGLGGRASVDLVVDANGVRSEIATVPLAASAPAVFTLDASGRGAAAALNQDGSVIGENAPAAPGSIIVLYGTGEGQTLPAGQDGALQSVPTSRPSLPVRVTIGGQEAQVLYAGGAPDQISGLLQVNVRVPNGLTAGNAPVVLHVGDAASPATATVLIGTR